MKINEALRTPDSEPTLEERLEAVEDMFNVLVVSLASQAATLSYASEAFAELFQNHVAEATKARQENDAADIGG